MRQGRRPNFKLLQKKKVISHHAVSIGRNKPRLNWHAQKILLPVNVKIERKLYVDMQKVL